MPVFDFARKQESRSLQPTGPPLRQYTDCAYKGHKFKVRMLANSYWVDAPLGQEHFSFVEDLLPVTDSLQPWAPSIMEMEPHDDARILSHAEDHVSIDMHMRQFRLQKPFGEHLAVFAFPDSNESTALELPGHEAPGKDACSEARAAADACCA